MTAQEGTRHEASGTREQGVGSGEQGGATWDAKPHHAQVVALGDALAASLRGVVEGLDEDLRIFAHHLAVDLAGLPLEPDAATRERRMREIAERARAIAGISRIRASNAAWDTVSIIIHTAARTLLAVALA